MSAHTTGPWVAVHQSITDAVEMFEIAEISHMRIVQDRGVAWPGHQGKPEDDARLIAAAPELLAVLMSLAEALPADRDTTKTCYAVCNSHRDAIHAAIAKATGETA